MTIPDTFAAGTGGPLDESTRATFWLGAGWNALVGIRQGEAQPRLTIKEDSIGWGSGSSAIDARVYRSSSGVVGIDASLAVASSVSASAVTVGGNAVWHAGNFNPATKSDVGHNHDGYHLKVAGDSIPSGTLGFGSTTRQMLNLWGTQYALGVQAATSYIRTAQRFSIHAAGTHSNTENDPGSGGSNLLTISSVGNEFKVFGSYRVYHEGFPPPGGGGSTVGSLSVVAWAKLGYLTSTSQLEIASSSGIVAGSLVKVSDGRYTIRINSGTALNTAVIGVVMANAFLGTTWVSSTFAGDGTNRVNVEFAALGSTGNLEPHISGFGTTDHPYVMVAFYA